MTNLLSKVSVVCDITPHSIDVQDLKKKKLLSQSSELKKRLPS